MNVTSMKSDVESVHSSQCSSGNGSHISNNSREKITTASTNKTHHVSHILRTAPLEAPPTPPGVAYYRTKGHSQASGWGAPAPDWGASVPDWGTPVPDWGSSVHDRGSSVHDRSSSSLSFSTYKFYTGGT